jgi:uncharacterized membrane protein YraQ (UPF0718 family)
MFKPIQLFADWLIFTIFQIDKNSKLGDALNFFVYDTLKILILLFIITFIMGIINSYFPVEKVRSFLSRKKLFGLEYFLASFLGAITPFCSCSSVPLFIGFVKGGIPLGVTLAFLIASPLVSEVALAVFVGMFGWKITLIYLFSGMFLGAFGGFVLGKLKLEKYLAEWVQELIQNTEKEDILESEKKTFLNRLPEIRKEAFDIVKKVFLYVILGIGVGAVMHGFIPTGFFEAYISKENPFAVPIAVLIGIPMYSNAAGVLPILQVLVQKGIPLGTALAFMMAVITLSIPEAILLKQVMTTKLISIYFGVTSVFIIILGYFFNYIL